MSGLITIENVNGLSDAEMLEKTPAVFADGAHESRSKRFTAIPGTSLVSLLRENGLVPVAVTQSGTRARQDEDEDSLEARKNFTKRLITVRRIEDIGIELRGKSEAWQAYITDASDGTSGYRVIEGYWRKWCSNGAMRFDENSHIRVRHTGNIVTEVLEGTIALMQNAGEYMQMLEEMKHIALTTPERKMLAKFAHAARFNYDPSTVVEGTLSPTTSAGLFTPETLLHRRRDEDRHEDLHTVSNVLQENGLRGGFSRRAPRQNGEYRGRMHSMREINSIPDTVKYNTLVSKFTEALYQFKASGNSIPEEKAIF